MERSVQKVFGGSRRLLLWYLGPFFSRLDSPVVFMTIDFVDLQCSLLFFGVS
jgi:hypothetical protein